MQQIYIQLQINTDPSIDSQLVWVVYNLANTIYKVFPENQEQQAYNYKSEQEKQFKTNGFISNTSRKEI
jgi:hypothetical protein